MLHGALLSQNMESVVVQLIVILAGAVVWSVECRQAHHDYTYSSTCNLKIVAIDYA